MKNCILILLAAFLLHLLSSNVFAVSATGTYKIKVHIPAIVGLNVSPKESIDDKNHSITANHYQTIKEEIVRNGELVIYQTTVIK